MQTVLVLHAFDFLFEDFRAQFPESGFKKKEVKSY